MFSGDNCGLSYSSAAVRIYVDQSKFLNCVSVGFANHLVDIAVLRPLGGDTLGAGSAAVCENHVIVFRLRLVEFLPDDGGVAGILAAGKRDEGALRQMRPGLFILAGADEVAGVDGG